MADLRDRFLFRHDAALASGKLTRGFPGGQLTYTEVIMSRLHQRRRDLSLGLLKGTRSEKEMTMRLKTVRLVVMLALVLLTAPLAAHAQPAAKVYRIGIVRYNTASANASEWEAFTQRLQELGYTEGQNLVIEWRFADGIAERVPALVAELVRLQVDCLAIIVAQRGHDGPFLEFQAHRDGLSVASRAEGLPPGVHRFRTLCKAQKLTVFSASGLAADFVLRIRPVEANKGRKYFGYVLLHGASLRMWSSGAKGQAGWRSAKA